MKKKHQQHVFKEKIGECTAYGDPHYKTCDGQDINFMGACKMTLSSTCERTTEELKARNLTYFNIEASNFRLVPKALVSYTQFLTVDIYDWRIQLGPGTAVLIGKLGTSPDGIKKMVKPMVPYQLILAQVMISQDNTIGFSNFYGSFVCTIILSNTYISSQNTKPTVI